MIAVVFQTLAEIRARVVHVIFKQVSGAEDYPEQGDFRWRKIIHAQTQMQKQGGTGSVATLQIRQGTQLEPIYIRSFLTSEATASAALNANETRGAGTIDLGGSYHPAEGFILPPNSTLEVVPTGSWGSLTNRFLIVEGMDEYDWRPMKWPHTEPFGKASFPTLS